MTNTVLDKAVSVREGEELDVNVVDRWLKNHITDLIGTPTVTQYSGGASNWTYCLAVSYTHLTLPTICSV